MKSIRHFYLNLFIGDRFFVCLGLLVCLFLLKFFFSWLGDIPEIAFGVFVLFTALDLWLLYRTRQPFEAQRETGSRLSNGDDNPVVIQLQNNYPFRAGVRVIDELPFQFQLRDKDFRTTIPAYGLQSIHFKVRPVKRGEYEFGYTRVFVRSPLALLVRRFNFEGSRVLPVYPSFLHMRKYELMAISPHLSELGIKRVRKIGQSSEFEQIKSYVNGDDIRKINWKASARQGDLMVNNYIDERAQHIYCIVDKSRVMRMPFDGLSLLDYAINASVALAKVAMMKDDKAGLITLAEKMGAMVPADRKAGHLNNILQVLYREKTRYLENNLDALYATIRTRLTQRSLLVFFTNFESLSAMRRQLPHLRRLSAFHLLLVVFFENSELKSLASEPGADTEGVYNQTIAEKFLYEKKLMVQELKQHGILSLLTAPQNLTVNIINEYLAIKARNRI
ncbi:DUF58 domain-containing protein [Pedobacter sp. SYP-B3415]|uniref:DUF58 domain-containing protein n=1 Tax=Pedobacter sp. SYP-B3415 TaxID=2496641 RepID=UPI00101C9E1E|nr:DUF58 domain-containing protein [Pedobacter sp. SYP-B3415]